MDWIDNLKPGDRVIVAQGGTYGSEKLRHVDRIGKLYVTVGKERFHKCSGYAPGHGYFKPYLKEATPERVSEIKRLATADSLKATDWRNQPLKVLQAVSAILFATEEQVDRILEEIKPDGR